MEASNRLGDRRRFSRAWGIVGGTLLLLLVGTGTASSEQTKLNVLFIAVDDLRPELGCYGATYIKSPKIDRLAARGLVFERGYCQQALCNPSRSSVLSGYRPETTGILSNATPLREAMPDVLTLPQHFKNNGWRAVSIGKAFHTNNSPQRQPGGENNPFDDARSWSEVPWRPWSPGKPYQNWFEPESPTLMKGLDAVPENRRSKFIRAHRPAYEASDQPDNVYPDGQIAAQAVETLRRLRGRPFFLSVGFLKPHLPFTCPRKYWNLYPAQSTKLPRNYQAPRNAPEPALHNWSELRSYGGSASEDGISDEEALNLIRGYRACVSFVDAQVGLVLDELDRLELRGNTVVLLWGDHGYHVGEQGIFGKKTNFELGTRVPLIVSVPGQKTAGQYTRALVELVDIYPTLAEICGLPVPKHVEGTSFAKLLEDPGRPWKRAAFSEYLRPGEDEIHGRTMRTDRWRYTEWINDRQQNVGVELYDHENDPSENVNVAGDPANETVVRELARQLHGGWREATPPPGVTVRK